MTSFGRMTDRPAVFVTITDEDGNTGYGEVWCNFPSVAAEHRVRLVNEVLAPLVTTRTVHDPGSIFAWLTERTAVLALQSGEHGPFAQAIAGVDLALWDLSARRSAQPLWQHLGGTSALVSVYASGINPTASAATAERARAAGHVAFKLKIGFDPDRDRSNLADLRTIAGAGMLAADVNQGWSIGEAVDLAPRLAPYELDWLEEPIRADAPRADWRRLAALAPMALAAGENVGTPEGFAQLIAENAVAVIQPDAAKWGGVSGCLAVARQALQAGRHYCPHYLGGGIGLLASAHLLAAAGGDGVLEMDINPNPLRDMICGTLAAIDDGTADLGHAPGIGIVPDLAALAAWRTS